MSLTSLVFFIFCFVTLIIYFIVPKKFQWFILLLSSIIFLFYNNLNVNTIVQLLLILLPSYVFSRLIEKNYNNPKSKRFLILGILFILAQLIYLKYTNLFLATVNHICNLFNINYQFDFIYRNSLIGISYYSLIMISYLTDIYRGACKAQKNIFKCALFMSYFPILTSGPFIRYESIKDDLYEGHKFSYKNMCYGLIRVLWGIFKIYTNTDTYTGIYTIIAVLFFTLQLFTNFSGSIDVIMGISEIIGISLPENFDLPFFSRTITELWRRWHITLGAWLKDYIFYPLLKSDYMQKLNKKCQKKFGKKKGKKVPLYISMLIMWIFIGIWHGGAYTYIIGSGVLQFIYIFLEENLEPLAKKINNKLGINMESNLYKAYQCIRTYLLFSFAMIFFRATRISHAIKIIKNMFVWNPTELFNKELLFSIGFNNHELAIILLSIILLVVLGLLAKKIDLRENLFKQKIIIRWGIIYALLFGVIIFGCYGAGYDATAFIYKQF